MAHIRTTSCCGLNEIYDVGDNSPERNLSDVGERFVESKGYVPFYIFTDIADSNGGKNLAKYIKKHKLGRIIHSKAKRNPNSGNMLTVWVWETNKKNFIKWYNKVRPSWAKEALEDYD